MSDGRELRDPKALLSLLCPNGILATRVSAHWPAILQSSGAQLAAAELLALLEDFSATQLAGVGPAGVALVTACILAAGGRYTGLMVRPARKGHGARRQVDGRLDPTCKVALIMDGLGSGRAALDAMRALEDEGMNVEGAAALVELPFRGGAHQLSGLGYRVATAFRLDEDEAALENEAAREDKAAAAASILLHSRPGQTTWSTSRLPEGLHPAVAARGIAEHFLMTGHALLPPRRFAQEEDGRGGVWVSLRRRTDDARVARSGFWHFDPGDSEPTTDVVLATVMTLQACRAALTLDELAELKIAVTFFSALEAATPADLDFDRYGIVVRSRAYPTKVGGALPDTQSFTSTFEQYQHAREANAGIGAFEPHDVFRHRVFKRVEPGTRWPAFGLGLPAGERPAHDAGLGARLARRVQSVLAGGTQDPGFLGASVASDFLSARRGGPEHPRSSSADVSSFNPNGMSGPATSDFIGEAPHRSVAVTLYRGGHSVCAIESGPQLEECAAIAARAVLARSEGAPRWPVFPPNSRPGFSVAVLDEPQQVGFIRAAAAARTIRVGRDSFSVSDGERCGFFLDADPCHQAWSKEEATTELMRRAGISAELAWWTTYKTTSWASCANRVYALEFGACRRERRDALAQRDVFVLAEHIHRRLDVSGWPACFVIAAVGGFQRRGSAAWCVDALCSLHEAALREGRADWREDAQRGLRYAVGHLAGSERAGLAVPGHICDPMADASLLYALARVAGTTRSLPDAFTGAEIDASMAAIAARISSWIALDGSIRPEGVVPSRSDPDALPGIALLGLAAYWRHMGTDGAIDWSSVFNWYRKRFELLAPWDLAISHSRLWPLVSQLTGEKRYGNFALEAADWMCANQLQADGSFLCGESRSGLPAGPSSQTAHIAEGIAAAWGWAASLGDAERCRRYERSWRRAMGFLDRLLVRDDDTYWMPEPAVAVGAVRTAQWAYELRADSSARALAALMAGAAAQESVVGLSSNP